MSKRVIRISEIASTKEKSGKLPVSQATIWRWVKEGNFPKPFKLGERITVWNLEEIEIFITKKQG
jgi:predicted DNA-binding transcriptional regulator AlpA